MEMWENEARESLIQRRSSLQSLLRHATEAERTDADAGIQEVLVRLSDRERRELQDINEALERIAQGHYGHCARCGGAIGRHRLRAVPEARHCMACTAQAGR